VRELVTADIYGCKNILVQNTKFLLMINAQNLQDDGGPFNGNNNRQLTTRADKIGKPFVGTRPQ